MQRARGLNSPPYYSIFIPGAYRCQFSAVSPRVSQRKRFAESFRCYKLCTLHPEFLGGWAFPSLCAVLAGKPLAPGLLGVYSLTRFNAPDRTICVSKMLLPTLARNAKVVEASRNNMKQLLVGSGGHRPPQFSPGFL